MRILDYNRLVRDLNGLSEAEFLHCVSERFQIEASPVPARPRKPGEFGLYLHGRWYRLTLQSAFFPTTPWSVWMSVYFSAIS